MPRALSHFDFGVVDLAQGPPVFGSLARSTTSIPGLYLDRALVELRIQCDSSLWNLIAHLQCQQRISRAAVSDEVPGVGVQ